jgi:mRNA interferase HigB
MRIISETRLREFRESKPERRNAEKPLVIWRDVVRESAWKSPADVKTTFGKNVDFVSSHRGSELAVFNIHGNTYRLIAAIHYLRRHFRRGRVYVLRIMTHAEYDENRWKVEL